MRIVVGARAAYWLWLLVPAIAIGTLLPAPSQTPLMTSYSFQSYVAAAISTVATVTKPAMSAWYITAGLSTWAAGAAVMFALLVTRQQKFLRSLGSMTRDATGAWRSSSATAPMLVGAFRPRTVLPRDFENQYSLEEQSLVLAHEQGHLKRRDIPVNALAAGWLCFSWFNPLMYWAIGRLRMDQELACDALVLEQPNVVAKVYANALLKTQFATESVWRMPVGCHWQSIHPLKERVAMLKQPLPGFSRRFAGMLAALAVAILSGSWAWAALPGATHSDRLILVHMKLTVTTPPDDVFNLETEILVKPGEAIVYGAPFPYEVRCTPMLPGNEASQDTQLPANVPAPADGQILLTCKISDKGKVVSTPSVITKDDKPASIEVDDVNGAHHFKLELNASTSKERIAAAQAEAYKRCQAGHQSSCRS
jgi:beta-lactamase regulating signal transducer with metallopeptidase domain